MSAKRWFLYCVVWLIFACFMVCSSTATIIVLTTNESYPDQLSSFGPPITARHGKLGFLKEPAQDPMGCRVVQPPCDDWIALVQRGGCSFVTKVRNMQKSGAIAVAVGDTEDSRLITMHGIGDTSDIDIPSVFLAKQDYEMLRYLSSSPLMVLMLRVDEWLTWPPIQLFFFIFISPSLVMLFLYVSYRLRQRQRHAQNLAPAHIVAQLPTRPFKREKSGENDHDECAICLEDYLEGDIIRILPCRHMFHASCVDAWLTTQKKFCPICKRDITLTSQQQDNSRPVDASTLLPSFFMRSDN